jgi:hypothetical protein
MDPRKTFWLIDCSNSVSDIVLETRKRDFAEDSSIHNQNDGRISRSGYTPDVLPDDFQSKSLPSTV